VPSSRCPDREKRLAHAERAPESIDTPVTGAEVARDQRAPRRAEHVLDGEQCIRNSIASAQEDPPGDLAIVEGEHVGNHYLVRLVAFAATTTVSPAWPMQRGADRRERSGSTA